TKVTVTSGSKCSDSPYAGASKQFADTPKTDVTVHAVSEVSGGTKSRIQCTGPSPGTSDVGDSPDPNDAGNPPSHQFADPVTVTANGLAPGTYTCTVEIDP